jgi:hypothetical protein
MAVRPVFGGLDDAFPPPLREGRSAKRIGVGSLWTIATVLPLRLLSSRRALPPGPPLAASQPSPPQGGRIGCASPLPRSLSRLAIERKVREAGRWVGAWYNFFYMAPSQRPAGVCPEVGRSQRPLYVLSVDKTPRLLRALREAFALRQKAPACVGPSERQVPILPREVTAALPDTRCAPGSRESDARIMRETAKGVDGRFLQESYKPLKSRQRIFSVGGKWRESGWFCPPPWRLPQARG